MKFLFDTNAVITFLNGKSLVLRNRISRVEPTDFAMCSVVWAELYFGFFAIFSGRQGFLACQR